MGVLSYAFGIQTAILYAFRAVKAAFFWWFGAGFLLVVFLFAGLDFAAAREGFTIGGFNKR
ncbi:hypothetical protein BWD07_05505 [Neisseria canis]|nr:hypothetical protein BWD07_05505 [Neisseria canis]